jgi:hypothetical protein
MNHPAPIKRVGVAFKGLLYLDQNIRPTVLAACINVIRYLEQIVDGSEPTGL